MNKGLTLHMGQQHGQKYAVQLLQHVANGELDPTCLLTHRLPLDDAPRGYDLFQKKKDGCVRVVFAP
jgi:threonine dehydrogenase-like Zn-dependent dehydrogenase